MSSRPTTPAAPTPPASAAAAAAAASAELAGPPKTYGAIVWGQLRKRPSAMISLGVILALALVAILAPFLAGEVPIRWVEKGETSWPIFRYLSNSEYAAMAAFVLLVTLPLTVRVLRPRLEPVGGSPWAWAILAHLAAWLAIAAALFTLREPERRYGFYLERAAQADSAWLPPIAYPRYPGYTELAQKEQPPSWRHPLGTGRLGDDVLMGILYGARTAMSIGFVAVGISMGIGVLLGASGGWFGGWTDLVMMRVAEVFMCFPRLILIIIILTVIPASWPPLWMVVFVLGITGWTGTYRFMRAELLRIRGEDYMTAARALGIPTWRLLLRHAVPNGMAPILVNATFGIAGAVFLEASLAFLNLVQTPSWGEMLNDGRQHLETWWVWGAAGVAIFVTVFVYNLLGEAIRDAIDPRLKV
ncbi:MAG: ABC transporter permease [Acidobacteria bacterium]|nr:ABC transporter permease [Acidobacteriota bacterium]